MPEAPWRAAGYETRRDPFAPGDAPTVLVTDPAQVPAGRADDLHAIRPSPGGVALLGGLAAVAATAVGRLGGEAWDAPAALLTCAPSGRVAWRGPLGFDPRAADAAVDLARRRAVLHPEIEPAEGEPARVSPTRVAALRALYRRAVRRDARAPRLAIKCPAPDAARAHRWGDWHLARSLARALADEGVAVRIDLADAWDRAGDADAALVLRGVRPWRPWPKLLNMMWLISHPARVSDDELRGYDRVFVASESEAAHRRARVPQVEPLLQCADPSFLPAGAGPAGPDATGPDPEVPAHEILFVGNSRKATRWVVQAALAAGHDVAVYGHEWEDRLPPEAVRGTHVPNDLLPAYYRAAGIVLNDHWPDMAMRGFVSNRLMDVGMAGGFVISDAFVGAEALGGHVETVRDPDALDRAIRRWQADPAGRAARAAALHAEVVRRHSVADRAARIAAVLYAET